MADPITTESTPLLLVPVKNNSSHWLRLRAGGSIMWQVLRLALPAMISYTVSASLFVTQILVSHIDDHNNTPSSQDDDDKINYEDASALIASMLNMLLGCSCAALFAMNFLVSHLRGELLALESSGAEQAIINKKRREIAHFLQTGLIMALLTGFFVVPLLYCSSSILQGLGQDAEDSALAQSYLRPYSAAIVGLLVRMSAEQIILAFERPIAAMVIAVANFLLGSTLATLLCFGYGLPKLGIPGVAYGFIVDADLTALGFILYLMFHPDFKPFKFLRELSFNQEDRQQLKTLARAGLPITLTLTNEIAAVFVLSLLAGKLGEDELAAQNFSLLLTFFTFIALIALGATVSQQISRKIGEKAYDQAQAFARWGLLATLLTLAPLCIFAAANPRFLAIMAAGEVPEKVLTIADILVVITAMSVLFDAARFNMLQGLRAAGNNLLPTLISIIGSWLGTLLAYVLAFHTELGIYGLATGYTIGLAGGALGLFPLWNKQLAPENLRLANEEQTRIAVLPTTVQPSGKTFWSSCLNRLRGKTPTDQESDMLLESNINSSNVLN